MVHAKKPARERPQTTNQPTSQGGVKQRTYEGAIQRTGCLQRPEHTWARPPSQLALAFLGLGQQRIQKALAPELHEAQHKLWAHFFDGPAANTRSKKAAQQPQQRG